jgi:hypothetical protein
VRRLAPLRFFRMRCFAQSLEIDSITHRWMCIPLRQRGLTGA